MHKGHQICFFLYGILRIFHSEWGKKARNVKICQNYKFGNKLLILLIKICYCDD